MRDRVAGCVGAGGAPPNWMCWYNVFGDADVHSQAQRTPNRSIFVSLDVLPAIVFESFVENGPEKTISMFFF